VTRRAAVFLYAFAGWTVFVWVVFIRNISKDHTHTTAFKVVHITLAVISIAFAAGCFAVVSHTRRRGEVRREGRPAAEATAQDG
jgi:hypothetical protein